MTQLDLFTKPAEQPQPMPIDTDDEPFVPRVMFADCRVPAANVEDFIARFYRGDRLQGYEAHCPGYVAAVIASHKRNYEQYGYAIISRHESVTGQTVAWPPLVA